MPTSLIRWDRPRGAVHSLAELAELSDSRTEFLCVSERTLYLIQNYAGLDVAFPARYAVEKLVEGYRAVIPDDPEWALLVDVVNAFQLEVLSMSCEIVPVLGEIRDILAAWQTNAVAQDGICCSYNPSGETWYEDAPVDGTPAGLCDLAYNYAVDWATASKEYYHQYAMGAFPSVGILTAILDEFDLPGQTALAMATTMASEALPLLEGIWNGFVDTLINQVACVLYQAATTTEAKASLEAAVDGLEGLTDVARDLLKAPFTYNSLNKVYDGTWPVVLIAEFDCEACGVECDTTHWEFGYGDLSVNGAVRPWVAERNPASHDDWYIVPHFDHPVVVEIVSISDWIDVAEFPDWRTWSYDGECGLVLDASVALLDDAVGIPYEGQVFAALSDFSSPDALVMSVIVSEIV